VLSSLDRPDRGFLHVLGCRKVGLAMQKLMMSFPWRARALTSASTTKAFSVPRAEARRLISGMGGRLFSKPLILSE
jgi:hypothetical protein